MCGRYALYAEDEVAEMHEIIRQLNMRFGGDGVPEMPKDEVFPTQNVPVYTPRGLDILSWGFKLQNKALINARAETAALKPLFQQSLQAGFRCLFIWHGYFEWQTGENEKKKLFFFSPGNELLYMAGLYEPPKPGERFGHGVILTTEPNASVAPYHNRMPLILPTKLCRAWLRDEGQTRALLALRPQNLQVRAG